jgi:predicted N-acetyltransferase YhbS
MSFEVRPIQSAEYAQAADLIARSFGGTTTAGYERVMHQLIFTYPRSPLFREAQHRVAVLKGQVISHALVQPFTLRYGGVLLRVAGVGDVCTEQAYSNKGYAAAVMRDVLMYVAEQGAHIALLDSYPNHYYGRFGFHTVFPHYTAEFIAHEAATLEMHNIRVRPMTLDDLPYVAALYEQHWAWRVTFTRTADVWLWRLRDGDWLMQVAQDEQGHIVGYMAAEAPCSPRTEIVTDTHAAACALMSVAGQRYRANGQSQIVWYLPPDDALVAFLRAEIDIKLSAHFRPYGGWMARLIDTEGLVQTLLPELQMTLAATATYEPHALRFVCESDVVKLSLGDIFCQLNHQDFIQLMFGSLRPSALVVRRNVSAQAGALLEALFPPRVAALAPWDWF